MKGCEKGAPEAYMKWKDLWKNAQIFAYWALAALIDGVFLVIWLGIQWFVSWVISYIPKPEGIDMVVFTAFQIIFAVGTLIPVLIWMYGDIRVMWIRIQKAIEKSRKDDQ